MNTSIDIKKIEEYYAVGTIKKLLPVNTGYLTENYIILTTQGKFFLKKSSRDSKKRVAEVDVSTSFFLKGGFPVLVPILSTNREKHVWINNQCYTLFPFINQKNLESSKLSNEHLYNLGVLLASMHSYSIKNKKRYLKFQKYADDWEKNRSRNALLDMLNHLNAEELGADMTLYKRVVNLKLDFIKFDKLKFIDLNIDDYYLIHGDFHNENVFFNKGGQIVSIFDFEKSRVGSINFELGRAMMIACFSHSYKPYNFRKAKYFLKGYTSIREISKRDVEKGVLIYINKLFYSYNSEKERLILKNRRFDLFYKNSSKSIIYFSKKKEVFITKIKNISF